MDELFLKKVSFLVFLIGFIGLIALFSFQSSFFIDLTSDVPLDSSIILNATILNVYSSSSGSVISFSYSKLNSGFFVGNTSFLSSGDRVLLTGSFDGTFFSIDSIAFD